MFDLNRLRTFRAVLAGGSVNGAAANLGYTPSAISQQLHTLQRETGLTLLERRGRGIAPTAAGLRFAEEAAGLMEQADRLNTAVKDLRSGRTGSLHVAHTSSAGIAWMPSIVAAMAREFPELQLDLRLGEQLQDPEWEPDVEIVVSDDATPPAPAGYLTEPLITEPYVVIMPKDHPLAGRSEIPLSELADEIWIDNEPVDGPCRRILVDAFAASGFTPSFRLEAQNDAAAVAYAGAGAGITAMARLSVAAVRPGDSVAVANLVDPTPTRTVAVQAKNSPTMSASVRRFLELLRERVRASL
ncbi:LysR family transcriptional regulator [Nesterenkonia muleiensis]|uniref:LysR family transcriptional regulator n=1 Tax=Nesterenkonia muleiensis TaxID=2282648 RepID=UPI000E742BD3|nr:LysR family transcriptional regulator [Nesterenkonia muleiensis]